MVPLLDTRRTQIAELCRRFRVRQLDLFGSAATGRFDSTKSDLDFLVEFEVMPPRDFADAFFGLREQLERLFQQPVDLITSSALQNPYLKASVDSTRELVYAI
jgi:uncharacterized protein